MIAVHVNDMKVWLECIERSPQLCNGSSGFNIFEVAAKSHVFNLVESCFRRHNHYRAYAMPHQLERVASHKYLLKWCSTCDTHDHHIDPVMADKTAHRVNQ